MDTNREYEIETEYIGPEIYKEQQAEQQMSITRSKRNKKILKLKWIILFSFFFIFFIGIDATHIWFHEHAHGAIFDAYAVNYTYGWKFDSLNLVFYSASLDSSINNCDATCMALQMENEIYTYNIMYIFYSIWMIFFIILIKYLFDDIQKILWLMQ